MTVKQQVGRVCTVVVFVWSPIGWIALYLLSRQNFFKGFSVAGYTPQPRDDKFPEK
jgi:hypothetical protein